MGPEEVEEVIISVSLADWLLYAHLMLSTTLQSRKLLALSYKQHSALEIGSDLFKRIRRSGDTRI